MLVAICQYYVPGYYSMGLVSSYGFCCYTVSWDGMGYIHGNCQLATGPGENGRCHVGWLDQTYATWHFQTVHGMLTIVLYTLYLKCFLLPVLWRQQSTSWCLALLYRMVHELLHQASQTNLIFILTLHYCVYRALPWSCVLRIWDMFLFEGIH